LLTARPDIVRARDAPGIVDAFPRAMPAARRSPVIHSRRSNHSPGPSNGSRGRPARAARADRARTAIPRAGTASCGDFDSCRRIAAFVDSGQRYANVTGAATVVVVPPPRVTARLAWSACTMDRLEQVVRHGDFRVVATAERLHPRTPDDAKWKVLVSLWKVNDDATSREPEMIRLEDRRSPGLGEALSDAVALAVRRIDERKQ
jgi:hypothetical protein